MSNRWFFDLDPLLRNGSRVPGSLGAHTCLCAKGGLSEVQYRCNFVCMPLTMPSVNSYGLEQEVKLGPSLYLGQANHFITEQQLLFIVINNENRIISS